MSYLTIQRTWKMLNANLTIKAPPTTRSHFEMAYPDLPESDWRNCRYKLTNETRGGFFVTPARAIHLVIADHCPPAFELTGICTNYMMCTSSKRPDVELGDEI